jgi:type II secretory pathway pseudopilin PulG
MIAKRKKKNQSGFSTLEILMAMFVLILALTAVVSVSFGNQSLIVDSRTNAEALNIAQGLLEKAQADSRKDFNLVNPVAATTTADGFVYRLDVVQTDNFTKLATAYVDFPEDRGRRGNTRLSAIVANFNNAVGGDTCSSILLPDAGAWKNPQIKNTFSNFAFLADVSDNFPVTDVDAYKNKLYVTVNNSSAATTTVPTFFILDSSNPAAIQPIAAVDNDLANQSGINAVAVAEDPAAVKTYAYTANASGVSSTGQLQIIDVTNAGSPLVKYSLKLPNVTGSQSVGNSIFYKNGFVYLGLKATLNGPEFHIIDVHDPLAPAEVGHWPATGNLGNDINAIYVRDRYAYLATPNSKNLIVLDISNASAPVLAGSYSDGGGNNGKSVFMVGESLYLGRTVGGTELSILDESVPATTTPPLLGSKADIDLSVDGIIVRGKSAPANSAGFPAIAFLATPSDFKALDISDPTAVSAWGSGISLSGISGNAQFEPVLDCEGNNFFIGSTDASKNGYLSIIAP